MPGIYCNELQKKNKNIQFNRSTVNQIRNHKNALFVDCLSAPAD